MLTGLGAIVFVKLIHFSWVLFGVVILWIIMGLRLYNEYRNSVRRSLEMTEEAGSDEGEESFQTPGIKYGIMARNDFFRMTEGEKYGYDESDESFQKFIISCSRVSPDPLLIPILKAVAGEKGTEYALEAATIIAQLEKSLVPIPESTSLDILGSVEGSQDKRAFVRSLAASGRQVALTDLLRLIRDNDVEVKRQAIFLAGKLQVTDMIPELCDCLLNTGCGKRCLFGYFNLGVNSFDALGSHFSDLPGVRLSGY
ncbi:MAG: HEAT repeat domain-containing protein [Bacteroidales bacterium]